MHAHDVPCLPRRRSLRRARTRWSSTAAPASGTLPRDLQGHLDRQERDILIQALHETGFNRTAAAARLGLSLRQIRYRIARLSIDVPANTDTPDDVG